MKWVGLGRDFFVHTLVESLDTCHGGLWRPRAELVAAQPLALSSNPPRALIASEISKGESVSSLIPRQNSLTTSDISCNTSEQPCGILDGAPHFAKNPDFGETTIGYNRMAKVFNCTMQPMVKHSIAHCVLCAVYFSAQPNKLRPILKFKEYYPIEHMFVPACLSARKIHFFKF